MARQLLRTSMSLTLVAALVFLSVGAKGCKDSSGANKYTSYVQTGVRVLGQAKTIFASNGLSTAKLDTVISAGNAAVAALESNSTNALDQVADFIDAFEGIASDADLIKDQNTRTIVLVAMAVGSEALHELADQMKSDSTAQPNAPRKAMAAAAVASDGGQRIAAFAAKPRWRCRNSINGQFAQMSFCKAHPDTATIERY